MPSGGPFTLTVQMAAGLGCYGEVASRQGRGMLLKAPDLVVGSNVTKVGIL